MTIDLLEGGVQTLYSHSNDTSECCDKGLTVTDLPLIRLTAPAARQQSLRFCRKAVGMI